MMEILRISLSTNDKGGRWGVKTYECKETAKTFSAKGTRIDKAKLLIADTHYFNNPPDLHFYTYCKPEQEREAIKVLIAAVNDRFEKLNDAHQELTLGVQMLNESDLSKILMKEDKYY